MIKTKFFLAIAVVLISFLAEAQETTSDFDGIRKNAISLNALGTTPVIGITYERVVSKNISLEIGVGIPSAGAGIKFFPWGIKESKILFHTGLTGLYVANISLEAIINEDSDSGIFIGYLPIGISYLGKTGFNLGLDIGPAAAAKIIPYGNLKLGFRF